MTPRLSRLAGTMPDRYAAALCGTSPTTVKTWRQVHGVEPARWHTDARARVAAATLWLERHPEGRTRDLAEHLRVTERTARRIRRDLSAAGLCSLTRWLAEQESPVTVADVARHWHWNRTHAERRLVEVGAYDVGDGLWVGP